MTRRASYRRGLAPRDAAPQFPQLWQGCVGAWCPSLGPTGLLLQDWSGLKRPATLTGIDPAADWQASAGQHALSFDGTDNRAATEAYDPNITNTATLSLWMMLRSTSGSSKFVTLWSASGSSDYSTGFALNALTTALFVYWNSASPQISVTAPSLNAWHHVCLVNLNGAMTLYLDGKSAATGTSGGAISGAKRFQFGGTTNNAFHVDGMLDDLRWYNRGLTANEALLLSTRRGIAYDLVDQPHPLQVLFHRVADSMLTQAADSVTGSGITTIGATAAITQVGDSLTAAGTLAISASAAPAQSADVLTSAAAVAIAATAASTQADDTLAGAAAVGIVADAAHTQGANALTGSVVVGIVADAAHTQGGDSAAGTGAVILSAAAALSAGADVLAASAALTIAAQAGMTAAGDELSASGLATSGATGSPSAGADLLTGTGLALVTAAASITQAAHTLSATAGAPSGRRSPFRSRCFHSSVFKA